MSSVVQSRAHGADTATEAARARTFHTLDALRGVAACAVLLFHAAFVYDIDPPAEGQIAVDLFFVMSGFIIAFRYDRDFAQGLSAVDFAKLRLARLYPLFLLGLVLGLLPPLIAMMLGVAVQCRAAFLETFGLGVVMLPSALTLPRTPSVYPLNYVAWSLALEIVVNLLYAASFRFWTVSRLIGLIAIGLLGLVFCAVHYGTLNVGFDWVNVWGGFARILFGFPMGVLLFRLHQRRPFASGVPWWVPVGVMVVLFFFDAPMGKPAWELFVVVVLIPLIVVAAVSREPPPIVRPAFAAVGIVSYALYSLHAPFVSLFLRFETHLHFDQHTQSPAKALIFTALLGTACLLADSAYDRPVRRWLSRFTTRRRPAEPRLATKN